MTSISHSRPASPIDAIADDFFDAQVQLSPMWLTELGSSERQDEYDDLSPKGLQEFRQLYADTLAKLRTEAPQDEIDSVTLAAMRERLGLQIEMIDKGYALLSINNIASSLHAIRAVYDQMPQTTDAEWRTIARRMRAVPAAIQGWLESQFAAIELGVKPQARQVKMLAEQVRAWVGDGGYFDEFVSEATLNDQPLTGELASDVAAGVAIARGAMEGAADQLEEQILPLAQEHDGVGQEAYQLYSREFLGTTIDLAETYQWGQEELARLRQQMQETAERIKPGSTIAEAIEALNNDPAYKLHGTAALQEWMQGKADEAIANLADTHFDIPESVRRIEGCIAPTHDGGIYYTGPSEDFTRPGRMWWSVPEGVEDFGTWSELTTVYHEGVPGHHLQIGQTQARAELLNKWRRMGCWVSGHGEGWALYAERLMAELGYLDDPGALMGLLDSQSMRAARVVLDIGIHCGFPAPEEVGGEEWTYDKAWQFFTTYVALEPKQARFELNRYYGWPGQAPSYKIGERLWLSLRDEVQAAKGEAFDLKEFHRVSLDVGSVGLDVLRAAVLDALLENPQ